MRESTARVHMDRAVTMKPVAAATWQAGMAGMQRLMGWMHAVMHIPEPDLHHVLNGQLITHQ